MPSVSRPPLASDGEPGSTIIKSSGEPVVHRAHPGRLLHGSFAPDARSATYTLVLELPVHKPNVVVPVIELFLK
jgi:hypothetical protein